MPPAKKAAPAAKPATSKPERDKPTELEAWQAAERGEHHPPPDVPAITEPGCKHPDCVLDHPHAGPAVLRTPHRAGGYVDRGDGRGWELEG